MSRNIRCGTQNNLCPPIRPDVVNTVHTSRTVYLRTPFPQSQGGKD